MGVSCQHRAPATIFSPGKEPQYPLDRRLGGVLRAGLDTEARGNILCLYCYHHAGTKGGGHIAPTHSLPWHWMGISGQRFTSAVLYCGERTPSTNWIGIWVGLRVRLRTSNFTLLCIFRSVFNWSLEAKFLCRWLKHSCAQCSDLVCNFYV
jgi:hypothetical protein